MIDAIISILGWVVLIFGLFGGALFIALWLYAKYLGMPDN